jgi:hypothetical protein
MLTGFDELARARGMLVRLGIPTADRLIAAWPEFWKAMFHEPNWPTVLSQQANGLVERMLAEGSVEATVAAMSDSERQVMINDLHRFIDDFAQHLAAQKADVRVEPFDRKRDEV